jgi:hypothetical protein
MAYGNNLHSSGHNKKNYLSNCGARNTIGTPRFFLPVGCRNKKISINKDKNVKNKWHINLYLLIHSITGIIV